MSFILRFTITPKDGLGQWSDKPIGPWYLVRTGDQWPHAPQFRLIHETTLDPAKARQFATEEDARAEWAGCGSPAGWDVVAL